MYDVERVAEAVWSVVPDATRDDVRRLFDRLVWLHQDMRKAVDYHPGYCECPPCAWLDPVSGSQRWHGTMTGYQYHKCRCERCKRESRNYQRSKR